ncbi:MAG: hypothetical protein OEY61_12965 [Gammaproteobacteria bacterium]|nr:hypothetical protein [Gammaproteobacteria bacterium]
MILDNYFIVIPVYRLDEDKYYDQVQKHVDKNFESDSDIVKKAYEKDPSLKEKWESRFRESYGGAWEFNEIIGYIKLYFFGNQIRGEYWAVNSKKIVKTRKKQFEYKTHKLTYELTIHDETNNGILDKVNEYINNCKKELKKRHLDTREFETLAPCIDWVSLYKRKRI